MLGYLIQAIKVTNGNTGYRTYLVTYRFMKSYTDQLPLFSLCLSCDFGPGLADLDNSVATPSHRLPL